MKHDDALLLMMMMMDDIAGSGRLARSLIDHGESEVIDCEHHPANREKKEQQFILSKTAGTS